MNRPVFALGLAVWGLACSKVSDPEDTAPDTAWTDPDPDTGADPAARMRINELFSKPEDGDDWVELYNAGTAEADLSGWHLSDQLSGEDQYTFPDGTLVGVGDFVLIWADEGEGDGAGPHHADFALSDQGETLRLMQPGSTVVHLVELPELDREEAWAALPDGSDVFAETEHPTPGAPNQE